MHTKNEEGFRPVISYPYDFIKNVKGITLPEKQYWALCKSLNIGPSNKEANFGWSDDYDEKGFYLYQHDDRYSLLTIRAEDQ